MNVGKSINFSTLKIRLKTIFTGLYSFWIYVSVVFLMLIILFFVFVYPSSKVYVKAYKDSEDIASVIERYGYRKDLYNEKWIASKKLESEIYDKEIEKCKYFLKEKDSCLEAVFMIEEPEKGLVKINDEAIWKNEYLKAVSALLEKLKANNIGLEQGALPFDSWGADIPTWETIKTVQKKFWIIESLASIAIGNNGVTEIDKIAFRESSNTYDPKFAEIYTAIPFNIKIKLQADYIKSFLSKILSSEIPYVIENISILGTDKGINPAETTKGKDNTQLPIPIISVTIDAYALDYKT